MSDETTTGGAPELETIWVCNNCGTSYEPGPAQVCPVCRRPDHYGQGIKPNMPKITVHGGPSYEEGREPAGAVPVPEPAEDKLTGDGTGEALPPVSEDEYDPDAAALELEGSEQPSDGTSSSTSSPSSERTPEQNVSSHPAPAPTTESPSAQGPTESSTASPTAGSGPGTSETFEAPDSSPGGSDASPSSGSPGDSLSSPADAEPSSSSSLPKPPKRGPGSTREDWIAYAKSLDPTLTDGDFVGLSRDDVIATIEGD
jgi:hypothetical protein